MRNRLGIILRALLVVGLTVCICTVMVPAIHLPFVLRVALLYLIFYEMLTGSLRRFVAHIEGKFTEWLDKRREQQDAVPPLPDFKFSLYLRSFDYDKIRVDASERSYEVPIEDRILRHMARLFPPVKVINQRDGMDVAHPAAKLIGDRRWGSREWMKKAVLPHAKEAKLIVICPGPSAGAAAELEMIGQERLEKRTIVIFPPNQTPAHWQAVRDRLAQIFNALADEIRTIEFDKVVGIYVSRSGEVKSVPAKWGPNMSLEEWDRDVKTIVDEYAFEWGCAKNATIVPVPHWTWWTGVLGALAGFSLLCTMLANYTHLRSAPVLTIISVIAILLAQLALSLEINWRLRAAIRWSGFWTVYLEHALRTVVVLLAIG